MAVEIKKPATECDRFWLIILKETIKADQGKGRPSSTFRFPPWWGWEEQVFSPYVYPGDREKF